MPSHYWKPTETPLIISWLITITCIITLLSALSTPLFELGGMLTPQQFFGLSWYGLKNFFLWQPVTYLFVHELSQEGITFFFLLTVAFNMYILWMLGSILYSDIGARHILLIYIVVGALAALTAVFLEPIVGQYMTLFGPSAALLALFMVWAMLYSDSILSLFFLIPLKTTWVLGGVLALTILVCVSQGDFVKLALYMSGAIYGYLYGILVLKLNGPFEWTKPIDHGLIKCRNWIYHLSSHTSNGKIFNLKGEPVLSDDEFVDKMLAKISKRGENSLTKSERKRMDEISARKVRHS